MIGFDPTVQIHTSTKSSKSNSLLLAVRKSWTRKSSLSFLYFGYPKGDKYNAITCHCVRFSMICTTSYFLNSHQHHIWKIRTYVMTTKKLPTKTENMRPLSI